MRRKKAIRVKVYLKEEKFIEVCDTAQRVGIRPKGLQCFVQRSHGFQDERLSNTDGLSKYYKFLHEHYIEHEAEHLRRVNELKEQEAKLMQEKRRLGL